MAQWGKTDTLADAPKYEAPTVTFDSTDTDVVDTTADTITIPSHGLATGQRVYYGAGGDPITGLTNREFYYVIRVDENTIQLAANSSNAAAGTDIDLTAVGTGTDALQVAPEELFFVDEEEAGVASNRAKGLRTGGWNYYEEWTDQNGNTRRRVEPLIAMGVPAADAGDLGIDGNTAIEDTTVADPA